MLRLSRGPSIRSVAPVLTVCMFLLAGCTGLLGKPVRPADYLTSEDYTSWLIEVDYVAGFRPKQDVLDFVKGRVAPLVDKPGGVSFQADDQLPARSKAWDQDALERLSDDVLQAKSGDNRIVTHLIFVDGSSASDTGQGRILGVAIGFDLVVIFSESIDKSCNALAIPPCTATLEDLLQVVTVHEFGHVLGLVNRQAGDGTTPVPQQSDHEDPRHKGHSKNRNSVMYWAVESDITSLFSGGLPTRFDDDDRADLCAAGGKC